FNSRQAALEVFDGGGMPPHQHIYVPSLVVKIRHEWARLHDFIFQQFPCTDGLPEIVLATLMTVHFDPGLDAPSKRFLACASLLLLPGMFGSIVVLPIVNEKLEVVLLPSVFEPSFHLPTEIGRKLALQPHL